MERIETGEAPLQTGGGHSGMPACKQDSLGNTRIYECFRMRGGDLATNDPRAFPWDGARAGGGGCDRSPR